MPEATSEEMREAAPDPPEMASGQVLIIEPQIVVPALAESALPDEGQPPVLLLRPRRARRKPKPAPQPPEPYPMVAEADSPPPEPVPAPSAPLPLASTPSLQPFRMVRPVTGRPEQRPRSLAVEPPELSHTSPVHIFARPLALSADPDVGPAPEPAPSTLPFVAARPRPKPPTPRIIQYEGTVIRYP